jgi:protein tyrosine/serine phosphatase
VLDHFVVLMESSPAPVYVHCHGGKHRAGALALAWRVRVKGWSWDKAVAEFEANGGSAEEDGVMLGRVKAWAEHVTP